MNLVECVNSVVQWVRLPAPHCWRTDGKDTFGGYQYASKSNQATAPSHARLSRRRDGGVRKRRVRSGSAPAASSCRARRARDWSRRRSGSAAAASRASSGGSSARRARSARARRARGGGARSCSVPIRRSCGACFTCRARFTGGPRSRSCAGSPRGPRSRCAHSPSRPDTTGRDNVRR